MTLECAWYAIFNTVYLSMLLNKSDFNIYLDGTSLPSISSNTQWNECSTVDYLANGSFSCIHASFVQMQLLARFREFICRYDTAARHLMPPNALSHEAMVDAHAVPFLIPCYKSIVHRSCRVCIHALKLCAENLVKRPPSTPQ